MSHWDALEMAFFDKGLVGEFDRLHGTNLNMKGAPIELMIDKSSGRLDSEFKMFVEFFDEYIWGIVYAKCGVKL